MNFFNSQNFLEKMIKNNIENIELSKELLIVYKELINKQAEIQIQWLKSDAETRQDFDKNWTERYKADADVRKSEYKDNTEFNKVCVQSNIDNRLQ